MKVALIQLILLHALSYCSSEKDNVNFYPRVLATTKDCEEFAGQTQYKIAKCDVYYRRYEFYMDVGRTENFKRCLEKMKLIREFTPSLFYHLQNVSVLTEEHVDTMTMLSGDHEYFVELIPQVKYFLGPGGSPKDVMRGVEKANTIIALSVAEVESPNEAYTQEFFTSLNKSTLLTKTDQIFLVLNGWHLSNIQFAPDIPEYFNKVYSGIVVWVARTHAHLIGKDTVQKYVSGLSLPVFLDMPGSPKEYNAASQLLFTPILFFISLLVLKTFF